MYGQCSIRSAALRGVEALPVDVEVVVNSGLPGMAIVGLADAAVQEARERVKAALRAAGFSMPTTKIVVNLAPSSLRKGGSGLDLPIAVGVLAATGQIDESRVKKKLFVGELSLDGSVRPVDGMLAYGIYADKARLTLVCGAGSTPIPIKSLEQQSIHDLSCLRQGDFDDVVYSAAALPVATGPDFADISGHEVAKRAFQIAAAGGHGLLMMGPPGSGKTMLASRLPSILPPLEESETLEAAVVHSVAGSADVHNILAGQRPFRHPHHSASLAGLVGGGSNPIHPGEISLAHNGVLFLDELAEFKTSVLQSIRQPMESGTVAITRADGNVTFPARFMLVAASNPCPCGYFGDEEKDCTCTIPQIRSYQARIGGPLLDRIDIHLDVHRVSAREVISAGQGVSSAHLREGVLKAREFATWRKAQDGIDEAVDLTRPVDVIKACHLSVTTNDFIADMAEEYSMSGRSIVRTLNVARTVADLEESFEVTIPHISEALGFRIREGVGSF